MIVDLIADELYILFDNHDGMYSDNRFIGGVPDIREECEARAGHSRHILPVHTRNVRQLCL